MMKMATELHLEMPHPLLDQIELFSRRRNKQPIFYPLCQYTCRLGTRGWWLSPLQNPRPRAGYLWKVNADVWKSKCKNDIRLTDDIKRPLLLKVHSSVFLFFLKMFRNHTSWRRLLIWISWNVCIQDWLIWSVLASFETFKTNPYFLLYSFLSLFIPFYYTKRVHLHVQTFQFIKWIYFCVDLSFSHIYISFDNSNYMYHVKRT